MPPTKRRAGGGRREGAGRKSQGGEQSSGSTREERNEYDRKRRAVDREQEKNPQARKENEEESPQEGAELKQGRPPLDAAVHTVALHDARQTAEESTKAFAARVRGIAANCELVKDCSCGVKVSFLEETVYHVVLAGLRD